MMLLVLAGIALATVACSAEADPDDRAATRSASVTDAQAGPPVRGCEQSVQGELAAGWREQGTITAGPLAFAYARNYAEQPAASFRPRADGRYLAMKLLLVVDANAQVTLMVAPRDRRRAALLYAPQLSNEDGLYRFADGTRAVTLQACGDRETQFNGGFIVRGRRCVAVDIRTNETADAIRRWLPFGTRNRPCPPD